jgi:hypothetical protein
MMRSSKSSADLRPSSLVGCAIVVSGGLRAVIEKGPAAVSESPPPQGAGFAVRMGFPAVA